jgi:acyl-coenzyme A thioesterase PaaI-like protein
MTPQDDVVELDPHTFGAESPCFGCSPSHRTGFHLRFTRQGEIVTTRFVPAGEHQGPPGLMHGGLVTTLADELAAWTIVALRGQLGFTAAMEARFSKPLRIGREVLGTGRIVGGGGRVVKVAVTLAQDGADAFGGSFTFAVLDRSGAERVLGIELPETWRKFCR